MGPETVYPACFLGERVGVWISTGECVRGILHEVQTVEMTAGHNGRRVLVILVLDQWFGRKKGPYQMFNYDNVVSIEPFDEPAPKENQI